MSSAQSKIYKLFLSLSASLIPLHLSANFLFCFHGIKYRADICIDKTIIEFQHSPITSEEFAKRNDFYLSCGYQVVWVFDATGKIKNQIGDSIDPMKCHIDDLCWKRAKGQFAVKIPPNVSIYLQYKTNVSIQKYANQELDIMLYLTKVSPKSFTFYDTNPYYISPVNFLKQYKGIVPNAAPSISEIIEKSKKGQSDAKKRQYNQLMSKIVDNHLRRYVKRRPRL